MKIPTIESNSRLNDPQIVQPDIGLYTNGGKAFSEVGKQLDSITQQFKQVQDFQEKTAASNDLTTRLDIIKDKAYNEKDPRKLQDYQKEIDDAIETSVAPISDNLVRMQTKQSLVGEGYRTYTGIANDFRKKQVDQAQADYIVRQDNLTKEFISQGSPADRLETRAQMDIALEEAVAAHVFDKADMEKIRLENNKNLDIREVYFDSQKLGPELMAKNRSNNYYSYLNDEEYNAALKSSRELKLTQEKQVALEIKDKQLGNEMAITVSLAAPQKGQQAVSLDQIASLARSGDISQEFAIAYTDAFTKASNDINPLDQDSTRSIAAYYEKLFNGSTKEDIKYAVLDMLKGGADKKISKDQMVVALQMAKQRFETVNPVDKSDLGKGSKPGFFDNVKKSFQWITGRGKEIDLTDQDKAEVINDWSSAVSNGEDPNTAAKNAVNNNILKNNPEITSADEIPNIIITGKNNIRWFHFNTNATVAPHTMYNDKTKSFDPNINRTITNK